MENAVLPEKLSAEAFEEIRLDLYRLAQWLMEQERQSHTLGPTALLGEVYIRAFVGGESFEGMDKSQLIDRGVLAMRRILTDHARRRKAEKRGGKFKRVPLDDVLDRCVAQGVDPMGLGEALGKLAKDHPRAAQACTLRFIAGFRIEEVAAQLEVCPQTIRNDLRLARAWLRRELERGS